MGVRANNEPTASKAIKTNESSEISSGISDFDGNF